MPAPPADENTRGHPIHTYTFATSCSQHTDHSSQVTWGSGTVAASVLARSIDRAGKEQQHAACKPVTCCMTWPNSASCTCVLAPRPPVGGNESRCTRHCSMGCSAATRCCARRYVATRCCAGRTEDRCTRRHCTTLYYHTTHSLYWTSADRRMAEQPRPCTCTCT